MTSAPHKLVNTVIDIQTAPGIRTPSRGSLRAAAAAALAATDGPWELSIRLVDEAEGAALNARYRGKQGATNVLAFPCGASELAGPRPLGDLLICAPVVAREAADQGKPEDAHWAHLVVHGVLHLLGYDHVGDDDAQAMEAEERRILAGLGWPDPYRAVAA